MRLSDIDALARLTQHDHGVLSTVHPTRGVDIVPVAYTVLGGDWVGIPVDDVKPKSSPRLQRERNLEADPRATLLADHWDPADWSQLWWVRARLRWEPDATDVLTERLAAGLADRYPQYAERPFHRILAFRVVGLTGWAATPS